MIGLKYILKKKIINYLIYKNIYNIFLYKYILLDIN
jgi:hypothetical protein